MRRERGFTLLEVLAALSVFGLILLILGQGMQFGLSAWRAQGRALALPDEMETLDRMLRRLVTRAVALDESSQGGPIQGGAGLLDVITRLPGRDGGAAVPTQARLEVDGTHRLLLRLVPRWHVRWQVPPAGEVVVLAERIERIEFAYWQPAQGGGGSWVRTWPGPALPGLVRMRLVFPAGDARHWPDIVAAPMTRGFAGQQDGWFHAG